MPMTFPLYDDDIVNLRSVSSKVRSSGNAFSKTLMNELVKLYILMFVNLLSNAGKILTITILSNQMLFLPN